MADADTFDWTTQTTRRGTCSRVGQYVRGTCAKGHQGDDWLVYDTDDETGLVCAEHYKLWSMTQEHKQACDDCGKTGNVWRDPLTRKNEMRCQECHAKTGLVFQNRWANESRVSKPLGQRERIRCGAAGVTLCKGEIKWYNAHKMALCNKHAGRTSSNPYNN